MYSRMYLRTLFLQKNLDIQFHVARSLAWGVVGLRMLKDSSIFSHYLESSIVLFGAISTLLPAYAYQMFDRNAYSTTYRPIVVILDNVLQVGLGCLTHQHIYPEPATSWLTASTWRAIAVYLTGSGFSWLNMSGLLGSLTFRFAWPQQTILTVIMLMASPRMCHRSYSLQKAHANAFIIVLSIMDRLLPQSILQYVMGSTYDAVVALRAGQDSESGYSMCVSGQTGVLLIFGFLLPTLYLFMHETRSRIRFIRAAESYSHQRAILFPYPSLLHYLAFAAPAMAMLFLYIAQQQ